MFVSILLQLALCTRVARRKDNDSSSGGACGSGAFLEGGPGLLWLAGDSDRGAGARPGRSAARSRRKAAVRERPGQTQREAESFGATVFDS